MIFGWLENGATDRWILVDAVLPWPALANGRAALREWADYQQRRRVLERSAGPRRCPWPCKVQVKDHGDAELRVWPCEIYAKPRAWGPHDNVWRPAVNELAELVAFDIQCPVDVLWMNGGTTEIERAVTPPGLRGRGFLCWGKGQHAPTKADIRRLKDTPLTGAGMIGADLQVMPQGDEAWL